MSKRVSLSRASSVRSAAAPACFRDDSYYFEDGNVVLLVANVLFRLHSSLLARESQMFKDMFATPARLASSMSLDAPDGLPPKKGKEGSCDENPIVMPQLQPQQFRNFLLVIYGRPGDKDFRSLFADIARIGTPQSLTTFIQLIDIVELAHRFIAAEVEPWALSQLKLLAALIESTIAYPISSKSQLRLLNYAKHTSDQDLVLWARHWTRSYYSWTIESPSLASATFATGPIPKIRDQLVREYKTAAGQRSADPAIFGYLFCHLLSLGHDFWKKHPGLAREDRVTLLGAQVHLTPLPQSKIPLSWLDAGRTVDGRNGLRSDLKLCSDCHFSKSWRHNFGNTYRDMVNSNAPLGGVFALTILPNRRQKFAEETKQLASKTCTKNCREICLQFIDQKTDAVYAKLADFCKKVE